MNIDQTVKLQAYLDNEVSSAEARETAAWLARDPDARQLAEELTLVKKLMAEGEVAVKLPESREFHWSKIQRGIAQVEPRSEVRRSRAPWWARILGPVAAAAAVVLLMVASGSFDVFRLKSVAGGAQEIETEEPTDDSGAITFRSHREGMTVVWIPSGR